MPKFEAIAEEAVGLGKVERSYRAYFERFFGGDLPVDLGDFVELLVALFKRVSVQGVLDADDEGDTLLFQYGAEGDMDSGEEFTVFDITRQFLTEDEETFQLSYSLSFPVQTIPDYSQWFDPDDSEETIVEVIKQSIGFQTFKSL